jgi:HSP20 family protein
MFKEADDLFDEVHKLHLQAERHFLNLLTPNKGHPSAEGRWQPPTDVYETDAAWVIKLELAGVRKDDFSVSINKGVLTVHGTRRDEFEGQWRTYHQAEIHYNAFTRSFSLPGGIDEGAIKARYTNGLLTITINKMAAPPTKRSKITITIT